MIYEYPGRIVRYGGSRVQRAARLRIIRKTIVVSANTVDRSGPFVRKRQDFIDRLGAGREHDHAIESERDATAVGQAMR